MNDARDSLHPSAPISARRTRGLVDDDSIGFFIGLGSLLFLPAYSRSYF